MEYVYPDLTTFRLAGIRRVCRGGTMQTLLVEVPDELFERLQHSRLARRPIAEQVKIALAIHLFMEGMISIGKAAELAGEPKIEFEWLLSEMGRAIARYDLADLEQDLRVITEAERRAKPS